MIAATRKMREADVLAAGELRQQHDDEKRDEEDPKQRQRVREVPDLVRHVFARGRFREDDRREASEDIGVKDSLGISREAIDIPAAHLESPSLEFPSAKVAELVDAQVSEACGHQSWGFESPLSHQTLPPSVG